MGLKRFTVNCITNSQMSYHCRVLSDDFHGHIRAGREKGKNFCDTPGFLLFDDQMP